jgi:DNA-binding MarR family transcriptional regulator
MNQIATIPRYAPRLPEELRSSTIVLLKRLGVSAKELTHDAYEELEGMHPYHHAILAVLDEGQRDTQGAIAEALGYDKGQLVGLLDELAEAGLIERQRDPNDRRRQIVRMTPAGRKHLEKLRKLSVKIEDAFLAPLSDNEREQLHALLLRLAEAHLPNCRFAGPLSTR